MRFTRHLSGQTLIEVVVALGISVTIISAVVAVVLSALRGAEVSRTQNQATLLAQEGIEVVRQIRDTDYSGFQAKNGIYCLDKNSSTLRSGCSLTTPNVDTFVRSVSIQQVSTCASGTASISAMVAWTDTNCKNSTFCHNANIITCLENHVPVVAP